MKVKIGYTSNGQKFNFEEKLSNFPSNMWWLFYDCLILIHYFYNLMTKISEKVNYN